MNENIEKHDELNPVLFENNKLKPEIRRQVVKIVDKFIEDLEDDELKIIVKDIYLVGSNMSYNYTADSDLDIHIIADSSKINNKDKLYSKLYDLERRIFNNNYEITIKGIPAEIYVELDDLLTSKSNGVYSIYKGWVKEPNINSIPDINLDSIADDLDIWKEKYYNIIDKEVN